jgi:hypothetical protein
LVRGPRSHKREKRFGGMLSERQQLAQNLGRELTRLGAWVTNPMPLDSNAKLRFQIRDTDREKLLEVLADLGWSPMFCNSVPRVTFAGLEPAGIWELDLPRDLQPIPDDRIHGEIATKEKLPEVEAMMKAIGHR